MSLVKLSINSYPPSAKGLVDIWKNYASSTIEGSGIDVVIFKNKRPKNPKTNNRRIAGLKAECISYLQDDIELVKMSVENFIYLMAKCGVNFQVEEVEA